ncbi:MAG: hypothetical protein ACKOHK_02400 [Planctomycetia bacterium]
MHLVTYSWLAVVLAVACAAIGWLGIAGWMAAAVVLASVAMHVAGNAIGTRLREETDRDLAGRRDLPLQQPALPAAKPTHLESRSSLGALVPVSAGIGAACGGLAGTVALLCLTASSPAGAVLGGVSSAVVGGRQRFPQARPRDFNEARREEPEQAAHDRRRDAAQHGARR